MDSEFINGTGGTTNITGPAEPRYLHHHVRGSRYRRGAAAGSLGDPTFWIGTVGTFAANHLNLGTSRWLINPADWYGSVLTSRDSLGRLLFIDNVTGSRARLNPGSPGSRHHPNRLGDSGTGRLPRVFIAQDQSPSVALLTERYADQDSIGVRVTTRWDLQLAQPHAVLAITAAA